MHVRYRTGLVVTYNDARFTRSDDKGNARLYTADPDKGGTWIATIQASAGATIEGTRACRSEFEAMTVEKAARLLSEHPDELRKLPIYVARDLKRAFTSFNAKTGSWQ